MIPPQELKNKVFTRAGKGYDMAEVDEYMDFIIEKYSEVFAQCVKYDKKLQSVVARISEIQSEEETIHKLSISTQKHCDRLIADAEETAREKILNARETSEKIIADAKERAQTAMTMIERKASMQIDAAQKKSDALLMSARTRCTKLLGDFKKEIAVQRDHILSIKQIAEKFNGSLLAMYKNHLSLLTENTDIPDIDLDIYTESFLFDSVMKDIKNDAIEIAKKTSDIEYDFEKELELLTESRNSLYNLQKELTDDSAVNEDGETNKNINKNKNEDDDEEDDVKVFAKTPNYASRNSASNNAAGVGDDESEDDEYTDDLDSDDGDESEKPRATYDSDDYDDGNESDESDEYGEYESGGNNGNYGENTNEDADEIEDETENDIGSFDDDIYENGPDDSIYEEPEDVYEEPEKPSKGGFLGLFKNKKDKKKKKESKRNDRGQNGYAEKESYVYDDDNDNDNDDDDDDREDEVMNIFEDYDDE